MEQIYDNLAKHNVVETESSENTVRAKNGAVAFAGVGIGLLFVSAPVTLGVGLAISAVGGIAGYFLADTENPDYTKTFSLGVTAGVVTGEACRIAKEFQVKSPAPANLNTSSKLEASEKESNISTTHRRTPGGRIISETTTDSGEIVKVVFNPKNNRTDTIVIFPDGTHKTTSKINCPLFGEYAV